MNVFTVEESLETHLTTFNTRTMEITKEILALQKEIEILDSPRDDSLDNNTVVWVSLAFAGSMSNDDGASQYDSDEDSGVSVEVLSRIRKCTPFAVCSRQGLDCKAGW